jgi:hypothetical protein
VDKGASLTAVNKDGKTPLDLSIFNMSSLSPEAVRAKTVSSSASLQIINMLLSASPRAASNKDAQGQLLLHRTFTGMKCSVPVEVVKALLKVNPLAAFVQANNKGKTPMHMFLESEESSGAYVQAVLEVLIDHGPVLKSAQTNNETVDNFCHLWTTVLREERDKLANALEMILPSRAEHIDAIVSSLDNAGGRAIDVADTHCKAIMNRYLLLCGRYELQTGAAEHTSATSIVRFAVDRGVVPPVKVALKFMTHREQFDRELSARQGGEDDDYVVPILASFPDCADIKARGFESHPHLLCLAAADRSLAGILGSEREQPSWTAECVRAGKQIATALASLHHRGILHGDIKPRNVVRVGAHFKLIDMDAAVTIGSPGAVKLSTAFAPPEVAAVLAERGSVEAQPFLDAWSFGATLYEMLTGATLFNSDASDNIVDSSDLHRLASWTDEVKKAKLALVKDRFAAHLLGRLLSRDRQSRLSFKSILEHPYFTGRPASRLPGEEAKYDVFLSYRKLSDQQHVDALGEKLEAMLGPDRVYWDRKLEPGCDWMDGFCEALATSRMFIAIVSRGTVNEPSDPRRNWPALTSDSPLDSVLLEYRLAAELKEQGLLEKQFTVSFGDKNEESGIYGDYFRGSIERGSCGPTALPDVAVNSVEVILKEQLVKLGLCEPVTGGATITVKHTWNELTRLQGAVRIGSLEEVLNHATSEIARGMAAIDVLQTTVPPVLTASQSTGASVSASIACLAVTEIDILREEIAARDARIAARDAQILQISLEAAELREQLRSYRI